MPTVTPLDTADLHRWRSCARRFWLDRQADAATRTTGRDPIGRLAAIDPDAGPIDDDVVPGPTVRDAMRASFPLARDIPLPVDDASWRDAVAATRQALDDPRLTTDGGAIFGACLEAEGVRVRIDVLARQPQGWSVHKVRLATVGDEADVDAVALWVHVAARAGVRVQGLSLLLVDTDFVYPGVGCYAGIFRQVDLAPVLGTRPVPAWLAAMRECERLGLPAPQPGIACGQFGGCGHAQACGASAEPPGAQALAADSLDVLGREMATSLREAGWQRMIDVPEAALAQPRHRRIRRAVLTNALQLEPEAATQIAVLGGPRRYLRIDTIGFAVPMWSGTQPYQALPFHWTCDLETEQGLQPAAFLADAAGDPRRRFAETLLAACGDEGPVYAYNAGFERNRLRELARRHDDLAPALDALTARIVDLFQLARGHCYHPAMAGSWSFKSIARALAPAIPVEPFDAANGTRPSPGGAASAPEAFARSLQRGQPQARVEALRAALIAQGHREAAVLQAIVRCFARAAAGGSA